MKNRIIAILTLVLVIGSFAAGFFTAKYIEKKNEPTVSVALIRETLEECSELTTAKLEYNGLVRYSEGDISFITKKSFSMVYNATIEAGIDMSKAEIAIADDEVRVILPQTEILSLNVDTDSLEFYDESFALFNWTKKEDTTDAVRTAKADTEQNADTTQLKAQASEQAKKVVENFLAPLVKDGQVLNVTFAQ